MAGASSSSSSASASASAALLSLLLLACSFVCLCSAAPTLFDSKVVPLLSSGAFRDQIAKPHTATLVAFCTPRNAKCRDLAPQYSSLSKTLAATTTVAWVDCKESADVCAEHDATDAMPMLKFFAAPAKAVVYKGREMRAKELGEWVNTVYPNGVTLLTRAGEKKTPRDTRKARVLLFTDKRSTSPLYKAIALALGAQSDAVDVAEVRKGERALLEHYGIGNTFPVLLVEPPVEAGQEPRSPRRYDGKMDKALILAFIQSFLPQSAGAGGAGTAAVPELADQSCVEKHCGGPLCMVMFLSRDHPELQRHLTSLAAIEAAARADKSTSGFKFVWSDVAVSEPHAKWAQDNFDISASEYPQLALLSVKKARTAPYVGSFTAESVLAYLRDVTRGRVKTIPFATRDGKMAPLPSNTQLCPPEKEEPKPAASKPAAAAAVQEEGELHVLTAANHDRLVGESAVPWVVLLHAGGDAHAATHPSLSSEFARVAKNVKNMVMFGEADLTANPTLLERYGVTVDQLPTIRAIAHDAVSKAQPSTGKAFPAADLATTDAKSIRAFALELLAPANVLVLSGQNGMQSFMGDLQPDTPFAPKLILFVKPDAEGVVVVPDMLKALALEFAPKGMTVGVASSRERDLARQFQVTKIPAAFTMMQSPDAPGAQNQVAVSAAPFQGPLTYQHLHQFCEQTLRSFEQQKRDWAARAAKQRAAGGNKQQQRRSSKPADEEDKVDLDQHEEL